jgi:hypothetical protein
MCLVEMPGHRYVLTHEGLQLDPRRNDLSLLNIPNGVLIYFACRLPADINGVCQLQHWDIQLLILVGCLPKVRRPLVRLRDEPAHKAHDIGLVMQAAG